MNFLRGLTGIVFLIGLSFLLSKNKKHISWRIVLTGLALQFLLGVSILYIPLIEGIFEFAGKIFIGVLNSTKAGSIFLFGDLADSEKFGSIFAFQILPTILFFSALMSILFYLGVIQRIVYVLAWLLKRVMILSGAESLAVTANIFLGQMEAPLMVKPYLSKMTNSELFTVMTSGMATIAGGVMAAYIGMLGGADPEQRLLFAKHLITASVMAAPGSLVIAKIIIPQDKDISKELIVPKKSAGKNILDAISKGTAEGMKLALYVGAMLIVFFALIAFVNTILNKLGSWVSLNEIIAGISDGQYTELSLEFIMGYAFAPVMWLIGVASEDITMLGSLLGEKIILTEFVSYGNLSGLISSGELTADKSIIMATYMLCGFANIASVGILIGGIGSLAPNKKVTLSEFGFYALFGGTAASLLSATIIGIII